MERAWIGRLNNLDCVQWC